MISHTSSTHGTPPPQIPSDRPRQVPTVPARPSDNLSTSNVQHLRDALASTPEIRPEVVEYGEQLAMDPNYPPRAIIEDIARQIVDSSDSSLQD